MSGFTLLWSRILDSSIWVKGSKEERLVWITLLAMKDKDGRIQASLAGVAHRARVEVEEARAAVERFLSPDPDDSSGIEEGRRLRVIDGGWEVVNHDRYRFSTEARREMWRQAKAAERAQAQTQARRPRQPGRRPVPTAVEQAAAKLRAAGDEAGAERAEQIEEDRAVVEGRQASGGNGPETEAEVLRGAGLD